jgi:DNA-binding PadR family transcriptional regulator
MDSDSESDYVVHSNITAKLRRRIIKNFLDIFVLTELRDSPLSGYDLVGFVHEKFNVLVSSGTIYGLLYSLEREGLIEAESNGRKRVYRLTEKGEQDMELVTKAREKLRSLMVDISLL